MLESSDEHAGSEILVNGLLNGMHDQRKVRERVW